MGKADAQGRVIIPVEHRKIDEIEEGNRVQIWYELIKEEESAAKPLIDLFDRLKRAYNDEDDEFLGRLCSDLIQYGRENDWLRRTNGNLFFRTFVAALTDHIYDQREEHLEQERDQKASRLKAQRPSPLYSKLDGSVDIQEQTEIFIDQGLLLGVELDPTGKVGPAPTVFF